MAGTSFPQLHNPPYQLTFSCPLPTGCLTYTEIPDLVAPTSIQWPDVGKHASELSVTEHMNGRVADTNALLSLKANSHYPTTSVEPFLRSFLQLVEKLELQRGKQAALRSFPSEPEIVDASQRGQSRVGVE